MTRQHQGLNPVPKADPPHRPVQMTPREYKRVRVIDRLVRRDLKQRQAAEELDLCVRQVRILKARYLENGAAGLVSRKRGRRSNRAFPEVLRQSAIRLVRQRYAHLGPTRAAEHLANRHGISVSTCTLNTWMTAEGLWRRRSKTSSKSAAQPTTLDSSLPQLRYIALFGDWVLDTQEMVAIADGPKGKKRLELIWHDGTICWCGTYGHLGGLQLQAVLDAVRMLLCPETADSYNWYVPRPSA